MLPDEDWGWIKDFYQGLDDIIPQECQSCNEKWFDLKLSCRGYCASCDRALQKNEIAPLSAANLMDPLPMPNLPRLTPIEEMLIARINLHIQVRRVRGQQYRYTGHIVCFMQNVQTIATRLPRLPSDLNIIIVKPHMPPGHPIETNVRRALAVDLRVRRRYVETWLHHLKRNHLGYSDIEISQENAQALPEDADILDELFSTEEPAEDDTAAGDSHPINDPDAEPDSGPRASGVVPNLRATEREHADLLAGHINESTQRDASPLLSIPMPSVRPTPVSNFLGTRRLYSLIFPTLFPNGIADFGVGRPVKVTLYKWAIYMLRYKDGRFARYPEFRYIVFNQMLREQTFSSANWYIKQNRDTADLTMDEIRQELLQIENSTLLRHIMRRAEPIKGTRPFWNGERYKLETIARWLGVNCLFVTFSAADV